MSRSYAATSGAPKQRCMMRGCSKWEFAKGLCKDCSKADPNGEVAALLSRDWESMRNARPIALNMVVVRVCDEGYMLQLSEGEKVHVLEHLGRLVVVRTAREEIGYYAADALKTEQQIYDEFTIEEDVQLILELENREEMERKKEAEFDAALKAKMKAKAEEDRRLRLESERRQKEEAERLLQEIEFRKAFEQQEQRKTAEEKRKQQALDAEQRRWREEQMHKHASTVREADEREFKAKLNQKAAEHDAWSKAEAARKDKEYLASLPAWKREVVMRKRQQEGK